MKNILHIISSPKGEDSFNIKLGNDIIDQLLKKHPGTLISFLILNYCFVRIYIETHKARRKSRQILLPSSGNFLL